MKPSCYPAEKNATLLCLCVIPSDNDKVGFQPKDSDPDFLLWLAETVAEEFLRFLHGYSYCEAVIATERDTQFYVKNRRR